MILAEAILIARLAALRSFDAADVPSVETIVAIIEHESRGFSQACLNEANGSSSRGLMMINRPSSRCVPEDDARFARDYDPVRNVKYGVWLLSYQKQWHRERKRKGDPLALYAGRGKAADRFALEIRTLIARFEDNYPVALLTRKVGR